VVASIPSVHIAETYGKSHRWRDAMVAAITEWGRQHDVPIVDLKAAVGDEITSGRGNPDGIHWNFEAHRAVADSMMKGLAEAGVTTAGSGG
jgi:lysophospholipase L1-like esterase